MVAEAAWKATLGELELQMTKATFNTWLKDARLVAKEEDEYVISVRNAYAKDWLENRLDDTIRRTLSDIVGQSVNLRYVVNGAYREEAPERTTQSNGASGMSGNGQSHERPVVTGRPALRL